MEIQRTVRPAPRLWGALFLAFFSCLSATVAKPMIIDPGSGSKDAPFFTSLPLMQAEVNRRYKYKITTAPRDDSVVTLVDGPDWLSFRARRKGKAILKGKPGEGDAGDHEIRLAATGSDGATTHQTFTLAVLMPPLDRPELIPRKARKCIDPLTVVISSDSAGASFRYTTDGSTPSATEGTLYTGPFQISRSMTLQAVAFKGGHMPSRSVKGKYTFAPSVGRPAVADAGDHQATVTGEVDPRGLRTKVWFEWSERADMKRSRKSGRTKVPAGNGAATVTAMVDDLPAGVPVYVRLVARSSGGKVTGPLESMVVEPLDLWSLTVNTTVDSDVSPPGKVTLRQAVARVGSGGSIEFDPLLDGGTIHLTRVGEMDSMLRGEVFTMGAGGWSYLGYQDRNYGPSALYAKKDLRIDAGNLPNGITLTWAGGKADPARILAVYGDLEMENVSLTSGHALARPINGDPMQPYSLGRGGALAVWGVATLNQCIIAGNRADGDTNPSRDRGAFGGGIYGDRIVLTDCVVSGNAVSGFGAAGGGVYSVGGAEQIGESRVERCTISGNCVAGQHAYGGGFYTDGGGRGSSKGLTVLNSTLARNQVEDHPGIADVPMFQYYYRGGGLYMSNGHLVLCSSTIVENSVTGHADVFHSRPNMGGGGVAATIGDAHVVESMEVWHCIVAGNEVNGVANDLFTGSLIEFFSYGYNLVDVIDFSHILVPIPAWEYLSRRHWPKEGDREGVDLEGVLDLDRAVHAADIVSMGPDAGEPAVLWYPPAGPAVDSIPRHHYVVSTVRAGYSLAGGAAEDTFLALILEKLRTEHGDVLGADFGHDFGDMSGVAWGGEAGTWPSDPQNVPWIAFWHDLDAAIGDAFGAARLGDAFWGSFETGLFGDSIWMTVRSETSPPIGLTAVDQLGTRRGLDSRGDVGAVEAD